jgi:hypothetical protein
LPDSGPKFRRAPLVFTYLFVSISYSASLPTQSVSAASTKRKEK